MSYLVLARKWRPSSLDELTGQEPIAAILKNAILSGKVAHAYIFSGPRGVGKTSTARILAKTLNCSKRIEAAPCGSCDSCTSIGEGSSMDVIEIDGASNNGVDSIRDLREQVRYVSYGSAYKIYIIDEAHMLTVAAFNALLKTLEEPPPHVIFVLATTDPKKIPATVLSRCQHLPFRRISSHKIKDRLKQITAADNLKVADAALEMVARAADGSMRDSLTILDQVISFSDDISATDVRDLLGFTDMQTLGHLAGAIISGDRKAIVDQVAEFVDCGTDLKALSKDFVQFMRDLLIVRIAGEKGDVLDISEEERVAISDLASKTSEEHLALLLSEIIRSEPSIRSAMFPRIALEMTLLKMSMMSHFSAINDAIRSIGGAEPERRQVTAAVSAPIARKDVPLKSALQAKVPKAVEAAPVVEAPIEKVEVERPAEPKPVLKKLTDPGTWEAILHSIEAENTPLGIKMRDGEVSIQPDAVKLVYNGGMSVIAESVKESTVLIQSHIAKITGDKAQLVIESKEVKLETKNELKDRALAHPAVIAALDLFEGRISDVYPLNDREGGNNV